MWDPPSVLTAVSLESKLFFLHLDASKKSTGLHKSHNRRFGEGKCSLYLFFLYTVCVCVVNDS